MSHDDPGHHSRSQPAPLPVRPPDGPGPAVRGLPPGSIDPRSGIDRRALQAPDPSGLERRRGPGRRRTDFTKSAEEGEMNKEQFLFLVAMDAFKKANSKTFPTWTDVLEVVRLLGYRKTCPSQLNLPVVEDWLEKADAPAGVRTFEGEEKPRA
ncbi:MAG: hypothetical protein ACKVZJ_06945 [Phycisphaerales bacterium]